MNIRENQPSNVEFSTQYSLIYKQYKAERLHEVHLVKNKNASKLSRL